MEIRSVKEVRVIPSSASPQPQPPSPKRELLSSPTFSSPAETGSGDDFYPEDDEERGASPIITQKLVVRFQEGWFDWNCLPWDWIYVISDYKAFSLRVQCVFTLGEFLKHCKIFCAAS